MRNRHTPCLCNACEAPLAGQENSCWRCGTRWAYENPPRTRLVLLQGGLGADRGDAPAPALPAAAAVELPIP